MTDKKRIEILKKVKTNISDGEYLCIVLHYALITNGCKYFTFLSGGSQRVRRIFPELTKHKPKNKQWGQVWWFFSKAPRLKVLNSMITEIKAKSND